MFHKVKTSFTAVGKDCSAHIEKQYRLKRDGNGNCIYLEAGERDVDEYINSFALGCSLRSLLERCSLMPTYDKIRYLNQTEDGVGADLTNIPKDGTEAFIMIKELKETHPDVFERFSKGESFDSIIKSMTNISNESEVINNGENESGND